MITPNSCEVSEQLKMKYELYFPKFSYKISFFLPNDEVQSCASRALLVEAILKNRSNLNGYVVTYSMYCETKKYC